MTCKYKTVNQPLNAEGLLKLDLQHFADPTPTDPPSDPVPTDPPADPKPQDPPSDPVKTFTQDDVNNLIARETKKQQEKMLKELGIEDFKGAKEGLAKLKEFQDAQKSDAEKQAETLKALEAEKGTLSSENATLKAQLSALKAGVKAESADDVVALAERLVNDETDIDAAIAQVIEKYPHFSQVAEPESQGEPKPQFSSGQHQKQKVTEQELWNQAFK